MPNDLEQFEEEERHLLEDGDDSSDESESGSGDDSSEEGSDDESGSDSDESGSDSEDDKHDDDDSGSGSGSDSDDDDSEDESGSDSGSGSGSGSGSESEDSSKKKAAKKKRSKKGKEKKAKEEKEEEEDLGGNAIFRIQQISTKLSFLLDDLHRTFKPKSVPKIDPQSVFPYPYTSLPTDSPKRLWRTKPARDIEPKPVEEADEPLDGPRRHFATHSKSTISSPIRHGDHVDRGAGGNYIYPSYAAPPSQHEIKKLYKSYSDKERVKIAENQKRERARKSASRHLRRDIAWEYETGNFSEEFISASNRRRQSPKRRDTDDPSERRYDDENELDETLPTTFDELYKHYDAERRLLEQKQNKMQRMKKKLYWFKKNNGEQPLNGAEKIPLKRINQLKTVSATQPLRRSQSVKEREKTLLDKAAEVLLGTGMSCSKPKKKEVQEEFDGVEASPDSLQEKILQIASEEEVERADDGHRLPTFV